MSKHLLNEEKIAALPITRVQHHATIKVEAFDITGDTTRHHKTPGWLVTSATYSSAT
jgi:hypothetical protein